MLTTFYPPFHFGGDAIYVYRLSNELARLGHRVDVVHCRDSFELFGAEPRPFPPEHPNVRVHTLSSRWKALSPLVSQQTGRMGLKKKRIGEILGAGDFDVIHYHNVSLLGGLDLLAQGEAIKLYSLHDYWLICPSHVLFKDNREACKRPRCLGCQLRHRRPPQLWRNRDALRSAVGHVDRFLAGSRFCLDIHRERGLELHGEVLPLFCGQVGEPDRSHDPLVPDLRASTEQPYYLFAGRLEKLKGLQDVIPYFRNGTGPGLLVAGSGGYEKELRDLAGGSRRIHFLGTRSPGELARLYAGAIATVMPSLAYEISPLVLAESWARGTPVIARNIGALAELVGESGGGLLFDSPDRAATLLDELAGNDERRNALGELGYAAYQRDWTPERHLERYLELAERLVESRHA